jgi:hypothetical protein
LNLLVYKSLYYAELQFAGGSEDANLVPGVENSIPVIEIRGEGNFFVKECK